MRKYQSGLNLNSTSVSNIAVLLFVLILSMCFSCSFEKPVAPQWDVNFPVPLVNRTLTMQELIDRNDFLGVNSDGLVSIKIEEELDRVEVGDKLNIADVHENTDAKVGIIEIASPGQKSSFLSMASLSPSIISLDGQVVPIPPFSFNQVPSTLEEFENFRSILIETGSVIVTLANEMPVPISPGLQIEVRDQLTGELVLNLVVSQSIEPDSIVVENLNLAGVRMPSGLYLVFSGDSPGSGTESVLLNAFSDGIRMDVLITDITVIEAEAIIEDQDFFGADSMALGDSILVSTAVISAGVLNFNFVNNIPLNLRFDLHIEGFYDQYGQPAFIDIPINSGENVFQSYDLSGYEFRSATNSPAHFIHFSWDVLAYSSAGNFITISSTDNVQIEVELLDLVFSELSGCLKAVHVEFEPFDEAINFPDGLDNLELESARMEIIINNAIGFPLNSDLLIAGINEGSGKRIEMSVQARINPANGNPVLTSIVLDENNSQIIEFLNIFPNLLSIRGTIKVGEGLIQSSIHSSDFIEPSVKITFPLSLSFPMQSAKTDVDTITIGLDTQDELRDNLLSGKLHAQISNHLPIGFNISLLFSSSDTSVYNNPELTIGSIDLQPAVVSTITGRVESETQSEIIIELTQEQIALFAHDEVYWGISLSVPGSNGQIYRIYADDYLKIKAYGEFKYHVDPENM